MAAARCRDGLVDLPWHAPRWRGNAPTLLNLAQYLSYEVCPLFHWEARLAEDIFHRRHPTAREQRARFMFPPMEDHSSSRVWSTLYDLNWDLFVRVVFTRFAERGGTHFLGVVWTWPYMFAILERHGFDDVVAFRDTFLQWVLNNPVALSVMRMAYNDVSLRHLNRPGAWLLDSVYTELLVIRGAHLPSVTHVACGNWALLQFARLVFSMNSLALTDGVDQNRNYVGNQRASGLAGL